MEKPREAKKMKKTRIIDNNNTAQKTKQIYIMASKTHTKFASVLRKFGGLKYNHISISLDEGLDQLYAFARPQRNGIFLAKLVRETVTSYTLGKTNFVDVAIYKIDVSEEQYLWIKNLIACILGDSEYRYNLLSVVTYPISRGFPTYKAFSCVEFVSYILKELGFEITKPLYRCKPDEITELLKDNIHFKGNLLDYKTEENIDYNFFSPVSYKLIKESAIALKEIFARSLAVMFK